MGRVTGVWTSFGQAVALAVVLEVLALLSPFYMQWVIDHTVVSADRDLLTTLAVGFAIAVILKVAFTAVRSWTLMHFGAVISIQWHSNVFGHLTRLPYNYFVKRHLGDIVSRFGSIDQIQSALTTAFLEAILDGAMAVVTLAMMFFYSRVLGAIALGAMVLYAVARWLWYAALRGATNSQIVAAAKQQTQLMETIRGARTIKIFGVEEQRRASWLTSFVEQLNAGLRTQKLHIAFNAVNLLLTGMEMILVVWYGARLILDTQMTVGALVAFKAYDDQFLSRTTALIDKLLQFRMLKIYGERLGDIVLTEPERIQSSERIERRPLKPLAVEVSNVRFRYGEGEAQVLNGVSFHAAAGDSVAIVGESGCGKSTLIQALLGVLMPTGGDIVIGGKSLRIHGSSAIREVVGCVIQDDILFSGSISENIAFFDPRIDQDFVEVCAKLAEIHGDITSMPMGYNTLVGDLGSVLSGGQKQRVLLARALYRRPAVLILDEATSSLDVTTERVVMRNLAKIAITKIFVAHRPETIAMASRVLKMRAGMLVEEPPRGASFAEDVKEEVDRGIDAAPTLG
jgi:ATP-binding cassette subfamily B protein RaxB